MISGYYTIDFNGKEYPLREFPYTDSFFVKETFVIIGTLSLQRDLFMEEELYHYVSKEAERIDERIIFFVDDDEIEKSDEYLCNLLRSEIDEKCWNINFSQDQEV